MLIATRDLEYAQADGPATRSAVRLYAPEHKGPDWACRFTIDWPDGQQEDEGFGVDAMQALILTLRMIGASIYLSDYHRTGRLYAEKRGSGYGFPVPKSMRSALIGNDARFAG